MSSGHEEHKTGPTITLELIRDVVFSACKNDMKPCHKKLNVGLKRWFSG